MTSEPTSSSDLHRDEIEEWMRTAREAQEKAKFYEQAYVDTQALLSEFRSMYFSRHVVARDDLYSVADNIAQVVSQINDLTASMDSHFDNMNHILNNICLRLDTLNLDDNDGTSGDPSQNV